jgi:hypothetical protein
MELGLRMVGNHDWPQPTGDVWPLAGLILLTDDGKLRVAPDG